jgi:hypothetical protein
MTHPKVKPGSAEPAPEALRNPLWAIAWRMACMFGAMAAVIALG